jgi:outer membrane protein TolC
MKRLLLIGYIGCVTSVAAQPSFLEQIEQNNTLLSALRQQADADKTGNKTGIYLENPEVEFGYLWGNNAEMGNRIDFSATQSIDFPTAYYYRKKVSEAQNRQIDLKYRIERKNILLEVRRLCMELTYQNALYQLVSRRLQDAEKIAGAYEEKYKAGETGVLDRNRAKLNLSSVRKEYNSCKIDREYLMEELTRLNGGITIAYPVSSFEPVAIDPDFERFYSEMKDKNLLLCYFQQETAVSKETEKLQRSLNLPKLSAGYMSEKTTAEHFQGLTVGLSIPLWQNKNTVKRIRAQAQANRAMEEDAALRYRNEAGALYRKAIQLSEMVAGYQSNILEANSTGLLKKALDVGEISLIDFIMETEIYFNVSKDLLEAERDLHLTIVELKQWEL